jgi:hypothetical protein
MKIGGSDSIHSIFSGHWRKFAQEIGVGAAALRARIRELCGNAIGATCESLALQEACAPVLAMVRDRARKLQDRLE